MSESAQSAARKILWIFTSFGAGAPQRRFATLISRLGRGGDGAGCEHVICALDGETDAQTLIEPGARFRLLDRADARKAGRLAGTAVGRLWTSLRTLAQEQPDLVITSGLGAMDWLAVNRGPGAAPHLHFEDPIGPEEALEGAEGRGDWTRRRALAGKDRIFVAEGAEFAELLTRRWGAPEHAVRRMPWGVDLQLVRPQATSGGAVVFGSLSPLVPDKRHDRILRILASLRERERDVSVRLVGQGPERRRLEIQAESLGVAEHVVFVDRDGLDPEVAAEETAEMDVYVDLADVSRSPAGAALALAAGLPFLGAASGVAAELAAEENALFLRPAKDESALAAAAELLAADPALRSRIGAANRAMAEEAHDLGAMVAAYEALIEELCGPASRLALPAPEKADAPKGFFSARRPSPDLQPTPVETFLIGANGAAAKGEAPPSGKKKLQALSEAGAKKSRKAADRNGPKSRPAGA